MLKIGDFARIGQVSIKALRHYDAVGLLRPAHIHPESGYRIYDLSQLSDLARILALKDCGFSLEEIAQLLCAHDAESITAMLRARALAQRQLIATERARLRRISARLDQLAAVEGGAVEDGSPCDVVLKRSEELDLLGLRRRMRGQREIGPFANLVVNRFAAEGVCRTGPFIHLYFEVDPESDEFDLFGGAPVSGVSDPPRSEGGWVRERLPEGEPLACAIHRGDYARLGAAFAALGRRMLASRYEANGPCREVYLHSPTHTSDPAEYVTEIQFPVALVRPD